MSHFIIIIFDIGAIVKKRFINMRDIPFMDNLRRMKESLQRASGKGADEIYKPKWPLYNSLLFLKETCAIVANTSNISTSKETFTKPQQLPTKLQNPVSQCSATELQLSSHIDIFFLPMETKHSKLYLIFLFCYKEHILFLIAKHYVV